MTLFPAGALWFPRQPHHIPRNNSRTVGPMDFKFLWHDGLGCPRFPIDFRFDPKSNMAARQPSWFFTFRSLSDEGVVRWISFFCGMIPKYGRESLLILEASGYPIWRLDGHLGFCILLFIWWRSCPMDFVFLWRNSLVWARFPIYFEAEPKSNMAARQPSWFFAFQHGSFFQHAHGNGVIHCGCHATALDV